MPTLIRNPTPSWPDWLTQLVQGAGLSPVMTSIPAAGASAPRLAGKLLDDLLGKVFAPKAGPLRVRLSGYDPVAGTAALHDTATGEPMDATLKELGRLLRSGDLAPEPGPYEGQSISQLTSALRRALR